jgi:YHS domain-containing protein
MCSKDTDRILNPSKFLPAKIKFPASGNISATDLPLIKKILTNPVNFFPIASQCLVSDIPIFFSDLFLSCKIYTMKIKSVLFLLMSTFFLAAFSQDANRIKNLNLDDGIAIHGYDPVAYFTKGKAVKGSKDIGESVYGGATYYFSSVANKEAFKKNAMAYEPQYGGWCAYAMGSDGSKVNIDPETFKIVNGKLYLFYNRFFNNTLKTWNKDEARLMKSADSNWQKISH